MMSYQNQAQSRQNYDEARFRDQFRSMPAKGRLLAGFEK